MCLALCVSGRPTEPGIDLSTTRSIQPFCTPLPICLKVHVAVFKENFIISKSVWFGMKGIFGISTRNLGLGSHSAPSPRLPRTLRVEPPREVCPCYSFFWSVFGRRRRETQRGIAAGLEGGFVRQKSYRWDSSAGGLFNPS